MGSSRNGSALEPSVSALIVTYNSERFIHQCLQALLESTYPVSQVVVVDNASADNSVHIVESNFPSVQVIRSPRNLGFAGACNLGLAQTHGQIIALVNPDVQVHPTWLGELVEAIGRDPLVAIAGGKLLFPDGQTIQHAGACVRYPLALSDHYGYRQTDDGRWDKLRNVEYVTGAALAIRREALGRLGGFDERFYPAYYEDTDLCWRARKAGFRVLYVPSAVGIHHESTSPGRQNYARYYYFHVNRLRFVLAHYSRDQLLLDFFPAEHAYLETISPEIETRAIARSYTEILESLQARVSREADAEVAEVKDVTADGSLLEEMERLQRHGGRRCHERSLAASAAGVISEMSEIREIPEPVFESRLPLLGPMIASFRSAWNWVSTKWYVRQILKEQNEVNAKLAGCLNDLAHQLIDLQKRVDEMELGKGNRE